MDALPPETEAYIKASIDHLVGLPVPDSTLRLKLLASEGSRRVLQDQVFLLQERLRNAERRAEQCKAEASLNAQGVRRCVEEKEFLSANFAKLVDHCSKLETECTLFEKDVAQLMESCDELEKENNELKEERAKDASNMATLLAENESLKKVKENLRINLHRAEEEVKLLYEENKSLDNENKLLQKKLNRENHQGSDARESANSITGKRKSHLSCLTEKKTDFSEDEGSRQPLSLLEPNSQASRRRRE